MHMISQVVKEWTEVKIKVPWGHIAGKWWGLQSAHPIIALHGWQDNAGSFDTLAPLLTRNMSLLAIDFPGHGLSSRLPDGMMYHLIDYVYLIRLIMSKYNWSKISLLGHSLCSVIGFIFASIFSDKIDVLIGIDALMTKQIPLSSVVFVMSNILDGSQKSDERNRSDNEPPSYSYEDCIEKLHIGSTYSVDKDKCQYLLPRNIKKSSKYLDKYLFTRDSRVKYLNKGFWSQEIYLRLGAEIRCPFLYIDASHTMPKDADLNEEVITVLKKSSLFAYHKLEGTHHLHLNNPEKVADLINSFLDKYIPISFNIESKL